MRRPPDRRLFGPGPYLTGLRLLPGAPAGFPFDIPVMARVADLELGQPITLLAGDNGTGKSTLLETIAEALGFAAEGGELHRSGDARPAGPALDGAVEPDLSRFRPRNGFFLRAESFYNVARSVDSGAQDAADISLYGGLALHEQSHGQSFLALAANRFGGEGIYLLDEPEAALSVTGAIALLAIMVRAAGEGAQFIVATHSPILLACPGARRYELHDDGFSERDYDDLDAVRLTRGFLEAPERYLRAALEDQL
jgi:predicted ATPase